MVDHKAILDERTRRFLGDRLRAKLLLPGRSHNNRNDGTTLTPEDDALVEGYIMVMRDCVELVYPLVPEHIIDLRIRHYLSTGE